MKIESKPVRKELTIEQALRIREQARRNFVEKLARYPECKELIRAGRG